MAAAAAAAADDDYNEDGVFQAYHPGLMVQYRDQQEHMRRRIIPFGPLDPLVDGYTAVTFFEALRTWVPGYLTVLLFGSIPIGTGTEVAAHVGARRLIIVNNNIVRNLLLTNCERAIVRIQNCQLLRSIVCNAIHLFVFWAPSLVTLELQPNIRTVARAKIGGCPFLPAITGSQTTLIEVLACQSLTTLPKPIEPGCGYTVAAGCPSLTPPVVPMATLYWPEAVTQNIFTGTAIERRWCSTLAGNEMLREALPALRNTFIFDERIPPDFPPGQQWHPLVVAASRAEWQERIANVEGHAVRVQANNEMVRNAIMCSYRRHGARTVFTLLPPEIWMVIREFLFPPRR
jgi:hypothetical protein